MTTNDSNDPPRTLIEIERRSRFIKSDWGFSLRRLIVGSNVVALAIAAIALTEGFALLLVVPLAFIAPVLASIYIAIGLLGDRLLRSKFRTDTAHSGGQESPFDN